MFKTLWQQRLHNKMKQIVTQGIILARTDYGEADRILTLLTPDHGKLRLMARGVRKVKSKLAGGIELFSVSSITFIQGRGELGTLASTRLLKHYGTIVTNVDRVMLGYELIQLLHKTTEDEPEAEYFTLLQQAFEALDDQTVPETLTKAWFVAQLLKLTGHLPNLSTDSEGHRLTTENRYSFSFDDMTFVDNPSGSFASDRIKFLRLLFSGTKPEVLRQIKGLQDQLQEAAPLIRSMQQTYLQ